MSSIEIALAFTSLVLFVLICIVLIADGEAINDYRARLREARKEIAELKMHDDEIRAMYPLSEGRMLMRQTDPRWTEIEEAEEEETK